MAESEGSSLLPSQSSDDTMRRDDSDLDSSDSDDEVFSPGEADRRILDEPEQHERLLGKSGRLDGVRRVFRKNRNDESRSRRARRLKEQAEGSGNAELMYEMEGGYKDTSSRSSSESLVLMQQKWNVESPRRSWMRRLTIAIGILLLFVLLVFATYKVSRRHPIVQTLSNGTHTFGPTTILISLDGFRADFLHRGLTPAMKAFVSSGVSPTHMLPSFPSLTFPNHFTLVTGMYPESHGIVSNQFWDPNFQEEFTYGDADHSMQPKWWTAEPLWVTAENQGLKTAIHMWPGSEAHIMNKDPTYLDKFNGSEALDIKVSRILEWLDMPQAERPQFIAAYVPNVDSDGHRYGPNSTEILSTITGVDDMLTLLVEELYQRNLTEIVNLIIVSDHGMATTSNERLIQLDDLIDLDLVDHIDGWPLRGLRLKNPDRDVPILHEQLLEAAKGGTFDVYTKATMPEKFHFSNNDRIAPLWVIPKPGWAVVEKVDFDVLQAQATGQRYSPMGLHGYDHEHPLMRAIFIARGPAFPHQPNSRLKPFQNIEVYNIVCDSLGITPHPNNGTLRLPLKVQGLHSDFDEEEIPADPTEPEPFTVTSTNVASTTTGVPTQPEIEHSDESHTQPETSWWDHIHNQIEKAKDWAKNVIESIKHKLKHGSKESAD